MFVYKAKYFKISLVPCFQCALPISLIMSAVKLLVAMANSFILKNKNYSNSF